MRVLFLILIFAIQIPVWGKDLPKARGETVIERDKTFWIGQKIGFEIVLYSPTWFSGTPSFTLPEKKELIIYKVPGSPVVGSEKIKDHSFATQRHEFALFSKTAGMLTIDEILVNFKIAQPGKQPKKVSIKTKPLSIYLKEPEQDFGNPYITTDKMQVTENWNKQIADSEFKVGDSITRTIRQQADNCMAMILPVFDPGTVENVSIYHKKPLVEDKVARGDFDGIRVDKVTYIFEKEGKVKIPGSVFYNWNPAIKEFEKHTLPEQSLDIAPNPAYREKNSVQSGMGKKTQREKKQFWYFLIIGIVVLISLAVFLRKKIHICQNEDREELLLKKVLKTAERGNELSFYKSLIVWYNEFDARKQLNNLKPFIDLYGSGELIHQYQQLSEKLFGKKAVSVDLLNLYSELVESRKNYYCQLKTLDKKEMNPFILSKSDNILEYRE